MKRIDMQKRALAARDAHLALLDLKKLVDEAAQKTRAAELDAVGMSINSHIDCDICTRLRVVVDHLRSANFEETLSQAREKLETAISTENTN